MSTVEKIQLRIDQALITTRDAPRKYLGASIMGTECARQLWYHMSKPKQVEDPTVLRKFKVGHYLEPMMVELLNNAGYQLFCTGDNQIRFEDGNIAGHADGVVKGIDGDEETPYLLEFKTANSFYFKEFVKNGISSNEKYAGQVQIYMHKFKLSKCLFMVMNKDTQDIYLEIIKHDEFEAIRLLERGKHILSMDTEPERHYPQANFFKCRFCQWRKECWEMDK